MQKERKDKNFLPKLIYPGGSKAMSKFLADHLKYPKEALNQKVEGTVRIKLDINYQGKVVDTQIMSSLGHGCDEEADRVVRLLRWDTSKKMRKGKILFHKTLNIKFKLPPIKVPKPDHTTTQLSYQIVKNTPAQSKKKKSSYQYTIRY